MLWVMWANVKALCGRPLISSQEHGAINVGTESDINSIFNQVKGAFAQRRPVRTSNAPVGPWQV